MPDKAMPVTMIDTVVELDGRIVYIGVVGGTDFDQIVRDLYIRIVKILDDLAILISTDLVVISSNIEYDPALAEVYDHHMLRLGMSADLETKKRISHDHLFLG